MRVKSRSVPQGLVVRPAEVHDESLTRSIEAASGTYESKTGIRIRIKRRSLRHLQSPLWGGDGSVIGDGDDNNRDLV